MTERLYDHAPGQREFTARVLECVPDGAEWDVVLDRTAFFPGGGGQEADTGVLNGVPARGAGEREGKILHRTAAPLPVGGEITGRVDDEPRTLRMQQHSGEHIVSGIVARRFGWSNVGFHMGAEELTVDFSGPIPDEAVPEIQREANRIIREDVPVTVRYPSAEELKTLSYRSKLDLKENVRIVTVGDYDVCACCAPHVARTGEIGGVLLLSTQPFRGGTRLRMLAGRQAEERLLRRSAQTEEISRLLSVPAEETAAAVERLLREKELLHRTLGELRRRQLEARIEALSPAPGAVLLFAEEAEREDMRRAVNLGVGKAGTVCAVFSGNDEKGYNYVIGASALDLRARSREINEALRGRGGGRPEMIEGSCRAGAAEIEAYFRFFR